MQCIQREQSPGSAEFIDQLLGGWNFMRFAGGADGHMAQDHMHPLTLLLLAIGVLMVVLGQTDYLAPASPSEAAKRMYALIREYSNWSFSLGIIAVFASAVIVFYGRLGYSLTEILALSIYCHALFIGMQIVNQVPLLVWPTPALMRWHQYYSPYYMNVLQAGVLLIAFKQFFWSICGARLGNCCWRAFCSALSSGE